MNEDEKARAIDMLAAHIRETRPYLFQLSARHDEELELIDALATETGSKASLLVRDRESGEMRTISKRGTSPRITSNLKDAIS